MHLLVGITLVAMFDRIHQRLFDGEMHPKRILLIPRVLFELGEQFVEQLLT